MQATTQAKTLVPGNGILLIEGWEQPEQILKTFKPSRLVRHPQTNVEYIAVAHKLQVVTALATLGIVAPSPVLTEYNWPGKFTPFVHQLATVDFLTRTRSGFDLSDMGAGKTAASLWAADYLMGLGIIKTVLVIAPLSCLEHVWAEHLFSVLPHRSYEVLHNEQARRRARARKSQANFLIVNHDGLKVCANELYKRGDIGLIIYDEAAALRNGTTERYKTYRDFKNLASARTWYLTGRPTPNAPTDAWALARLINYDKVERSFKKFQERTMLKVGTYKWIPRKGAEDTVYGILQPAIRHRKEDCIELPPMTYTDRACELSREQVKHFNEMRIHLRTIARDEQNQGHPVTAVNAAGKLIKLLQILQGSVYSEKKYPVHIPMVPRRKLLVECIEASPSKTIVFAFFKATLYRLQHELEARHGIKSVVIDGSVKGKKRAAALRAFKEDSSVQILLAQPRTAAHGLNLTVASTIVWFGPIFSSEQYEQANERVARPGQKHKMTVVHIGGHPTEWKAYEVPKGKIASQNKLLRLYETTLLGDGDG